MKEEEDQGSAASNIHHELIAVYPEVIEPLNVPFETAQQIILETVIELPTITSNMTKSYESRKLPKKGNSRLRLELKTNSTSKFLLRYSPVERIFRKRMARIARTRLRMRCARDLTVKRSRTDGIIYHANPPITLHMDDIIGSQPPFLTESFSDTLYLPPELLETPAEAIEIFENLETLETLENLENLENLGAIETPQAIVRTPSYLLPTRERPRRLLSEKRLAKRLVDLKMREIKVRDDGNCLFYAVAQQLEKDETRHSKIRENVVNWLLHNSDYLIDGAIPLASIEEENGKTWEQFCKEMSKDKTFGTNACLYAISEIYGVEMFAVFSTEGSEFVLKHRPSKMQREEIVRLSFCDNNKHFNILEYDPAINSLEEEIESNVWHCESCTRENYEDEIICFSCATPKYRKPGGWICDVCSVENDADSIECFTCKDCIVKT